MTIKQILALSFAILFIIAATIGIAGSFDSNNIETWQIVQSPNGSTRIQDEPGYYATFFANVYTWPRARQMEWGKNEQTIKVTFNDGGRADLTGSVRYEMPRDPAQRIELHKKFNGNPLNVDKAIISHLINCIKVTGPVMSSSENQSARKAEFNYLVHEQLQKGLFESKKIEQILKDQTDETGKPITVFATEIVKGKDGQPIVQQVSPLVQYGIEILQFSIEETNYDQTTLDQFDAKKAAFLAAERSKAEREQEVQQRLMIVEKGLREKAEVEAIANKEAAKLIIEAERAVKVATQEKEQATIVAAREVAIAAEQAKQQQEIAKKNLIEYQMKQEIAIKELEISKLQAEGIKITALAEADRLKMAGALSEEKRVLAEIQRDRDIQVAKELARIATPSIVFNGGKEGANVQESLMNLWMLRAMNIIPVVVQ